jgi:hypothetical protein
VRGGHSVSDVPGRVWMLSLGLTAALCCAPALAVARDDLAVGDEAPRYDPERDRLELAAWGVAPPHPANLAQLGLGSRRSARLRALRALHGWIDAAMRERTCTPDLMTRLHGAAERDLRDVGLRFLADGTVVLRVELGGATLRAVTAEQGLPWVR